MKKILLAVLCCVPLVFLSGCCADDLCDTGSTFKVDTTCKSCNKSCNTCGYDAGFANANWY